MTSDRDAFERTVRAHSPMLLAYASMRGAGADAPDVVQEAWIAAYIHQRTDRAFLFTVVNRRVIDLIRKRRVRRVVPLDLAADLPAREEEVPAIESSDLREAIMKSLEAYPLAGDARHEEARRGHVELVRILAGIERPMLTAAELGRLFGVTPTAILLRKHRLYTYLRNQLPPECVRGRGLRGSRPRAKKREHKRS